MMAEQGGSIPVSYILTCAAFDLVTSVYSLAVNVIILVGVLDLGHDWVLTGVLDRTRDPYNYYLV